MRHITASQLATRLGTPDEPFLIDVRDPDEHADWVIPGARNIPLSQLAGRIHEIPPHHDVVVLCASGARSSHAWDVLRRAGIAVTELDGGMQAWGQVYDTAEIGLEGATVIQVRRRGKGCLSYVVGHGTEAFVIDPSTDPDRYLQIASDKGWTISRVFDTHLHADHVSGARSLAHATGATLHLNPHDTFDFSYVALAENQSFALADGAVVEAITTPGHTEGSTIYRIGDQAVLTGDTVFVDGVGRPDLAERAGEFAANLYRSIHEVILPLGNEVIVLPGHFGDGVLVRPGQAVSTTVGSLRDRLPELWMDRDTFVAWAESRTTATPPNYTEIIMANMGRARFETSQLGILESGPNRCSV